MIKPTKNPRQHERPLASSSGQTASEYIRIMNFLGITTQLRLAERLGVKQSSISDGLNRSNDGVPANWKLTLLKTDALSPMWVETGCGAIYLIPSGSHDALPARTPLAVYSSSELLDELQRRFG